jgi:hypothetical protein
MCKDTQTDFLNTVVYLFMLTQFIGIKIFKLFISKNNIRILAGGSEIYVAELTLCFICV